MKKIISFCGTIFLILLLTAGKTDTRDCSRHITQGFIPFDKEYMMEISQGESANYQVTFYDGFVFRLAACTDIRGATLIFSVFDNQGNILFTNKEFELSPYWDFVFKSTLECTVKVELQDVKFSKAKIWLLVAYKGL